MAKKVAEQEYGDQSIVSLKGADRVRKRPAVIFGSDGLEGCEHSAFEIISNSVDEAREGHGNLIRITVFKDHSIEVEDTATALVEYPSGALGVIEAATSTPPGFERRIEIHGTEGFAEIINSQLTKLYINNEAIVDVPPTILPGTASDPTKLDASAHRVQYRSIIRLLNGGEALHTGAQDGYAAIRLIEEIYEKSKSTD